MFVDLIHVALKVSHLLLVPYQMLHYTIFCVEYLCSLKSRNYICITNVYTTQKSLQEINYYEMFQCYILWHTVIVSRIEQKNKIINKLPLLIYA